MNSYKIIFPFQSNTVHLAASETEAFDMCFAEIKESGKNPSVFVVLNLNTNTPYYLEISKGSNIPSDDSGIVETVVNKDVRDNSDTLSTVPIAPFDNMGSANQTEQFNPNNPLNPTQNQNLESQNQNQNQNQIQSPDLTAHIQKQQILEKRIDYLESEIIKMKMKVDYVSQVTAGHTNMNNLRAVQSQSKTEEEEAESCIIQ